MFRSLCFYATVVAACCRSNNWREAQIRSPSSKSQLQLRRESADTIKSSFPFYHTSQEITTEARRLTSACALATASMETKSREGVSIDVVSVKGKGETPSNRVFILFGEHSRELISPETGLHLLKVLCGEATAGQVSAVAALKDSEFQMVLNANPRSRVKVEAGEYCLRANPNGVDLNRNWDEQWQNSLHSSESFPGAKPFSELETQIVKDLVTEYKPHTFLTVHSGTLGMYMPWAFDTTSLAERNKPAMLEILKTLDTGHCECPYGAAGKEVGYACPGTSLDWVYDKLETPFAFAFEIWGGEMNLLKERWQEKVKSLSASLLQSKSHVLADDHFSDLFEKHPSDFVQVKERGDMTLADSSACLGDFNPTTEESYRSTLENWAGAYLEMSQMIAAKLKEGSA